MFTLIVWVLTIQILTYKDGSRAVRVNPYGIRRSLIDICSITEVKRRRARFISGWVTAWDCQVPYTLSWGSENHVNQMARLTDFELDVKEPQWT